MRTIDLSPLYRTSVGFDRMASMLDAMMTSDGGPSYPPYNIEKTGDSNYRISLAVAGFTPEDVTIETKQGDLVITGSKVDRETAESGQYLHRGIAERAFERRFKLADHVRVHGAKMENGLLHVDLVREVPEELKPRRIAIETAPASAPKIAAE